MITEDYVSYEIAKLLKEKGFTIPYDSFRGIYVNGRFKRLNPGSGYLYNSKDEIIEVCSLQMAMKWLREVHNKSIEIRSQGLKATSLGWIVEIYNLVNQDEEFHHPYTFPTYEQACESAIKYCLENLI